MKTYKREFIAGFCELIKKYDRYSDIVAMDYEEKDGMELVIVRYSCGSVTVNVTADSILAMTKDVCRKLA